MSFGSPSRNGLNHTEQIPYDRPAYGVAGEADNNKTPWLFGPVNMEQIQINDHDDMTTNDVKVLKEADVDIQTEETGQKKD